MIYSKFHALLAAGAIALLAGCAQPYPTIEPEFESNWQTEHFQTDVYVIPSAPEAFARRVQLVRQAEHSIDMTYFSWGNDTVGMMLLNELKLAAERGVNVRLALDDLLVFNDKWLADLATHDNIQIRLFNPFDSRKVGWIGRAANFSSHQKRLDNRLHEKYFNVDHQWMILGGRNIGDDYFGYSRKANFFDMDVLFQGPIIEAFSDNYQRLWDSEHLVAVEHLIKADQQLAHFTKALNKQPKDKVAIVNDIERELGQLAAPRFVSASVYPVFDSLEKLNDNKPYFRQRAEQLIARQMTSVSKALISTPYLVPSDNEFTFIDGLLKQQAQVEVFTNSSASNDSGFIPAYYEQHRKTLLNKGVHIWEYKDGALNDDHFFHANTYYHNKTVILDEQVTYIGSSNFDPRSDYLNIEFGVLIDSKEVAAQVEHYLTRQQSELFWEVSLDQDGKVQWQSQQEVHKHNPNYSAWHAFPNWIFKKMNGEFEL